MLPMLRNNLFRFAAVGTASGVAGYYVGKDRAYKSLEQEKPWQTMTPEYRDSIFPHALKYGSWDKLSVELARKTLSAHLDASQVPHGDLAVPSRKIHSGRYIITQWQRVATGAAVVVLSRNKAGDLCVALGSQRGKLVQAQGYMESHLPKDDLTGLRERGASRINGSTGKIVKADDSIEDTAEREVWEELGLLIQKNKFKLLSIGSTRDSNPIVHTVTVHYVTNVGPACQLQTLDTEFAGDDMSQPKWYPLKNITCIDGHCYAKDNKLPLHPDTVIRLKQALNDSEHASKADREACRVLLNFKPGSRSPLTSG